MFGSRVFRPSRSLPTTSSPMTVHLLNDSESYRSTVFSVTGPWPQMISEFHGFLANDNWPIFKETFEKTWKTQKTSKTNWWPMFGIQRYQLTWWRNLGLSKSEMPGYFFSLVCPCRCLICQREAGRSRVEKWRSHHRWLLPSTRMRWRERHCMESIRISMNIIAWCYSKLSFAWFIHLSDL